MACAGMDASVSLLGNLVYDRHVPCHHNSNSTTTSPRGTAGDFSWVCQADMKVVCTANNKHPVQPAWIPLYIYQRMFSRMPSSGPSSQSSLRVYFLSALPQVYWDVPGTSTGVDAAYSFHSFEDPYFSTCLFSSPPVARRIMDTIWKGPMKANTQWYLKFAQVGQTDQDQ